MTGSADEVHKSGPSRRQMLIGGAAAAATGVAAQLTDATPAAASPSDGSATTGVAGLPADVPMSARPIPSTPAPDPLVDPASFANPPAASRPWFRWWWKAPLDTTETAREVAAIADAGFGGVEIGFVNGAWADDAQRQNLGTALATAASKGIKVDMTMGAAWPLATPNTAPGTGLEQQECIYGRADVPGGTTFTGTVPSPIDDLTLKRGGTVLAVTAARVITRGPAATPGGSGFFSSPILPPASSTVLDPDSLVDLTSSLTTENQVTWKAPKGDWILFAFWVRDTSQKVHNHFYKKATEAAADYLDEYQIGAENLAAVRQTGHAMFEDSLENDAVSLFWTPAMVQEFTTRRGYSPIAYLPVLFAEGMTIFWIPSTPPVPDFDLPDGAGTRIRNDYYKTLQDLYEDDHITVFSDWAARDGVKYRAQVAYGLCLDPVRSARALAARGGLPEGESLASGDRLPWNLENPLWRFAMDHQRSLASGTHQAGQPRVSTELGAVYQGAFQLNLNDLQGLMAKEWAAGFSLPIVHGFQYQTATAKWPGDLRFGENYSDSWNDRTWPQWPLWKRLTDYWGRGTMVLEAGVARADVAIYRDGFLTTAGRLTTATDNPWLAPKQLFDAVNLEKAGFSLNYLDPQGLVAASNAKDDTLFAAGPGYRALIIDQRSMPAAAAEALVRIVRRGVKVVFVGDLPSSDTSYSDPKVDDRRVRSAIQSIARDRNVGRAATQADAADVLARMGLVPAVTWSRPVQVYAQLRQTQKADLYMIYNATSEHVEVVGSFASTGTPVWLDLWDGSAIEATQYAQRTRRTDVPLRLAPLETRVIGFRRGSTPQVHVVDIDQAYDIERVAGQLRLKATESGTRTIKLSSGSTRKVTAALPDDLPAAIGFLTWNLHVDEASPSGTIGHDIALGGTVGFSSQPGTWDWRSLAGLQTVSGVGTYTSTTNLPSSWIAKDRGVYLDLGRVYGAVQVFLNGQLVSPDITAGGRHDVTKMLVAGANTLKVVLYSTLRNEVTAAKVTTSTKTQETGVEGPVRLVPYTAMTL